jgi:hypothetical protein
MSFRIHSASPELKHQLESKLAELQAQLDEGFEYEISAEILPLEQALGRAEQLAQSIGAESVFVAEGVLALEPAQEVDPDFAMGLPPVAEEHRTATHKPEISDTIPVQEVRSPRIAPNIKDPAAAKASQAHATLQRAGEQTGDALKATRGWTARFLRHAGAWAAQKKNEAATASVEMRSRLAAKSAEWKTSLQERNAKRQERRAAELKARQERQRAAHREAELAAISAQIMLERQRSEEKARTVTDPSLKPTPRRLRKKIELEEQRDLWPVWRNAFVAAACLALVGVIILASGGKQSSATPATSTELSRPEVVVPAHIEPPAKTQPAAAHAVAQVAQPAAKPSARKRVARASDKADDFQDVTVRHYPNAAPLAPPKRNAKGVVQISDME